MTSLKIPLQLDRLLWQHQRDALKFAVERLRGSQRLGTALVRLPTGTGKTGIIAVLAIVDRPSNWTLVLTPWRNLCDQMIQDLDSRFWTSRKWNPKIKPSVQRLYPSNLTKILENKSTQNVLVATFATLVTIFRKHRKDKYGQLADRLSEVFVDEGHYEPAVEWGQAVKQLNKPTLLLTATPYRNDLKLFRVKKEDVFNFTHKDAVARRIIREVEFRSLGVAEPTDRTLRDWCDAFVKFWNSARRRNLPEGARAIVCCAQMSTVREVTRLLREQNLNAIGIHEGFAATRLKWLKRHTPDPSRERANIWVHQQKLTEGLDDSRFCVLAFVNRIANDRKLIQQIGRIVRTISREPERAFVVFSEGLPLERSWKNYREFETQPGLVDPDRYRKALEQLLQMQPEMEYFGKRFRRKFETESPGLASEVLLPTSCAVREIHESFQWNDFVAFTSDFLLLNDCIILGPNSDAVVGPGQSRLWVYAVFGNTPMLIEHSHYEMRLGAMAAVQHHDLLFIADTEGVYPYEYIGDHGRKIRPDQLGRIFPSKNTTPKQVSLLNSWPTGPAIKGSTAHADNLEVIPAQLSDSVFICSNLRASVKEPNSPNIVRHRYAGFERGRIAEQLRSTERSAFSLKEFVDWTKELGGHIVSERRKLPAFFKRYLAPVDPPSQVIPNYFVLNFFESEIELIDQDGQTVELVDSIVEVKPKEDNSSLFEFILEFRRPGSTKIKSATIVLSYDSGAERFRVQNRELNSEILVRKISREEDQGLIAFINSVDESFTVVLNKSDVFYTSQAFYQIDFSYAEAQVTSTVETWAGLANVRSEKGRLGKKRTSWEDSSIFGLLDSRQQNDLIRERFGRPELLICDDLNTECADFVCVNFSQHKIAFIHAKHGDEHKVAASALHVVVAQAQKNLGIISRSGSVPGNLARWNRKSKWSGTAVKRWRVGSSSLPTENALWQKIRTEILDNPDGTREIWLVLGATLNRTELLKQLASPNGASTVAGHVVYLLSCLRSNCTQLNAKLRVFCD
jgi:superfamily II DNA or RNA helicase